MAHQTNDGDIEQISPNESNWYLLYLNNPMVDDSCFHKSFRHRFGLPYSNYEELACDCQSHKMFKRWTAYNVAGWGSLPIDFLTPRALRYLGRGWIFDNLEEATAILEEVYRVFLHKFIDFGSMIC